MPTGPKDSQRPAAPQVSPGSSRQERLAQALRDNLKKRKAQQRERKEGQRERKEGQGGRAGPRAAESGGDDSSR